MQTAQVPGLVARIVDEGDGRVAERAAEDACPPVGTGSPVLESADRVPVAAVHLELLPRRDDVRQRRLDGAAIRVLQHEDRPKRMFE